MPTVCTGASCQRLVSVQKHCHFSWKPGVDYWTLLLGTALGQNDSATMNFEGSVALLGLGYYHCPSLRNAAAYQLLKLLFLSHLAFQFHVPLRRRGFGLLSQSGIFKSFMLSLLLAI